MLAISPQDVSSACAHHEQEYVGTATMMEGFSFDDLFLDFDDKNVMPGLEVEPAELDLGDFLFDMDEKCFSTPAANSPSPEAEHNHTESKKSSTAKKKSHKNKKGKVDWTPELHRRFVQAVELLGIEKAVPSRILEIMEADGLTRHNIASHLQKYRSHRRHLLAREAAAASWSQRRRMKGQLLPPTIGFPPPPPAACMPLHVWGHPPPPPLPPHWIPPPQAWPYHYPMGPNGVTPGILACYPRPVMMQRFPASQHPLYRAAESGTADHPNNKKKICPRQRLQLLNVLPSKESVDAAIGDVLAKPWLPLPLGLKPPSLDSVLVELQKQGISNIPPVADLLPSHGRANKSVDL